MYWMAFYTINYNIYLFLLLTSLQGQNKKKLGFDSHPSLPSVLNQTVQKLALDIIDRLESSLLLRCHMVPCLITVSSV